MSETSNGHRPLQDQVAVITGGASGIGRATAVALAQRGARVVVVDVNPAKIAATVAELAGVSTPGQEHLGVTTDVRSEAAVEDMARQALEKYGRIDILVASAGILRAPGSGPLPLAKITTEEWDQVLDTNLKGMFLTNRAVLPAMMAQRGGNIINISSVSGKQGRAHDAPYCASKFGVIGMTESLAEEVRNYGIRVQIVIPDAVDTPIWEQNGPIPCPVNAMPPERVADLIAYMLTQPPDTLLLGAVIAPFRTRDRVGKKKKAPTDEVAAPAEGPA